MIQVQLKMLDNRVNTPRYETGGSAGIDLQAAIDETLVIEPGETVLISTGISIFVGDRNYASVILPRSGLGHKKGLVLGNGVGLIDSDYQGTLFVSATNRNSKVVLGSDECGDLTVDENSCANIIIEPLDRIAQLVFLPIIHAGFALVTEFHEVTQRGEGGFGSTGVNVMNVNEGDIEVELPVINVGGSE
tara:strand:- start:85486 stop:86055 length:570 start_codon:yes stop_codon:yes gene_type:complete